jgi:hypothetical protein
VAVKVPGNLQPSCASQNIGHATGHGDEAVVRSWPSTPGKANDKHLDDPIRSQSEGCSPAVEQPRLRSAANFGGAVHAAASRIAKHGSAPSALALF